MMPHKLRRVERRNYKRPLFEELPCLDARWLARKKLVPKDQSTRRYNLDFIVPHISELTLTARTAKILTRDGREQKVAIHWHRNVDLPRFRGHPSICVAGVHDGKKERTLHA